MRFHSINFIFIMSTEIYRCQSDDRHAVSCEIYSLPVTGWHLKQIKYLIHSVIIFFTFAIIYFNAFYTVIYSVTTVN